MATIEIKSLPKFRQILESTIREYAILALEAEDNNPINVINLQYLNELLFDLDLENQAN